MNKLQLNELKYTLKYYNKATHDNRVTHRLFCLSTIYKKELIVLVRPGVEIHRDKSVLSSINFIHSDNYSYNTSNIIEIQQDFSTLLINNSFTCDITDIRIKYGIHNLKYPTLKQLVYKQFEIELGKNHDIDWKFSTLSVLKNDKRKAVLFQFKNKFYIPDYDTIT